MVDGIVQLLKFLFLHGGLELGSFVEEGVDLIRLLAQFCRGRSRCRNIVALVQGDDRLRSLRVVMDGAAQLLAALLRLGIDRVIGKDDEQVVRLLERILRIRGAACVVRDDVAAQLAQPLMEVILCLEQCNAVLDRDGEQMLIVHTGRLELVEHDGKQYDHQGDNASDESCQLQPDGHSLSHKILLISLSHIVRSFPRKNAQYKL